MAQRREGQVVARGKGRWLIRWSLGVDAQTGRYRAKSKTIHGTRKDAEKELRRVLRTRDTGEYVEPSKETLDAYLDRWLVAAGSRLSAHTLQGYKWMLKRYVRPHLGSIRLDQIRPLDVQEMLAELTRQAALPSGRARAKARAGADPEARPLSARTIRLSHAILSSALRQAVRWGQLFRNPADFVDLPRQQRQEMHALSAAQVATFREKLQASPHAPLVDFLLGTGCRPGEALALRWADLDLEQGRATVRRSLTKVYVEEGGKTRSRPAFKEPKTAGSRRAIPLPPSLVVRLRGRQKVQAESALKLGDVYDRADDLVFPNEVGQPLDLRNVVNRHIKPALEAAGLPRSVRLYDLRHTHATALLAAGVHPKVASERLGHATTRQTLDTYSHVLPGMQEEATQRVEETLFQSSAQAKG